MQDVFSLWRELIDMRSFGTVWFWIAVAVQWSVVSHFAAGVPFDMVQRARRHGGQAAEDLDQQARISARRFLTYAGDGSRWGGAAAAGALAFLLASLATLGFGFGIEIAQAVFLLLAPLVPVGALTLRSARRVLARDLRGAALWRELSLLRVLLQGIGVAAIFLTAFWGIYVSLDTSLARVICGPRC